MGLTGPRTPPVEDRVPGGCGVRLRWPRRCRSIAGRVGIDLDPPDLTDPDDARWLLACVWPGTGRFQRAARAIELGQSDPPPVLRGGALETLPGVLADLAEGRIVVLNSWSFSYFSLEQRQRLSSSSWPQWVGRRPVVWLCMDAPGVVEALASGELPAREGVESRRAQCGDVRRREPASGRGLGIRAEPRPIDALAILRLTPNPEVQGRRQRVFMGCPPYVCPQGIKVPDCQGSRSDPPANSYSPVDGGKPHRDIQARVGREPRVGRSAAIGSTSSIAWRRGCTGYKAATRELHTVTLPSMAAGLVPG